MITTQPIPQPFQTSSSRKIECPATSGVGVLDDLGPASRHSMATVASVSWNETAFLVLRLNDQHIDLPVSIFH